MSFVIFTGEELALPDGLDRTIDRLQPASLVNQRRRARIGFNLLLQIHLMDHATELRTLPAP